MFKKVLFSISVIVVVLTVYLSYSGVYMMIVKSSLTNEEIENKLESKSFYDEMYDFTRIINLGHISIVKAKYGLIDKPKPLGNLDECINYMMDNFTYVSNQPNPNKLKELGGNCQALSIYFKELCESSKIKCSIVIDRENKHSYNIVTINNKDYIVDIAKKEFREVE